MTRRQKVEASRFYMDVSKLCLGTWVIGIFSTDFEIKHIVLSVAGFLLCMLFYKLGLELIKD